MKSFFAKCYLTSVSRLGRRGTVASNPLAVAGQRRSKAQRDLSVAMVTQYLAVSAVFQRHGLVEHHLHRRLTQGEHPPQVPPKLHIAVPGKKWP